MLGTIVSLFFFLSIRAGAEVVAGVAILPRPAGVYIVGAVFITVPSFVTFILPLHYSRDLVSGRDSDSHNEVLFLLCCV